MHPLFHYINKYSVISEKEFKLFLNLFTSKKLRKKQLLLEEEEICNSKAFLIKGAMRKYFVDEKGNENTTNLYVDNWWVADRESFIMNTPSIYNIEALEDCELLLISRENTLKFRNECPAFNELILKLNEQNSISSQKRINSYISVKAEQRYLDFINEHPYFIDRFPQHMIASYLGITKDTLSRLRRRSQQK